jgi:hypothetical protein
MISAAGRKLFNAATPADVIHVRVRHGDGLQVEVVRTKRAGDAPARRPDRRRRRGASARNPSMRVCC